MSKCAYAFGIGIACACLTLAVPLAAQSPPCTVASGVTCTSSCAAETSWFNSGQINVTSLGVDVSNPVPAQQTNCMFHQLAWQDFLYLVSPASGLSGQLNFETWMTSNGIFVASGAPVAWGSSPAIPASCSGTAHVAGVSRFMGLTAQTDEFYDGDFLEAGSLEPLIDQNGNYVHYEMRVNEIFYDFIVDCQLYQSTCFNLASSLQLPNGNASTSTVGTIELKTAWKTLVDGVDDFNRFYTVQAAVQPASPSNSNCVVATLGLVGMHIVHKTPSHPEMIWATFEQVDNAPNCDNLSQTPPNGKSWSFYPAGTTCSTASGCTSNCCNSFTQGQTTGTLACRSNTCGGGSESGSENQCNIQSLNNSVHSLMDPSLVWQYYYLTGAVWFDQSQPAPPPQAGSTSLANVTAETYTQTIDCFTCHTAAFSPDTPQNEEADFVELDFSHIFGRIQQAGSCTALPASCTTTASSAQALRFVPSHGSADGPAQGKR